MGKYEEALERAKAGKPLDEVFPELKESEDERIRKEILEYFGQFDDGEIRGVDITDWIHWLEKQKEQKPAEWSKEDEQWLGSIIKDYEDSLVKDKDHAAIIKIKIDFLQSLRPQPHWKPTEEQMKALDIAIRVGVNPGNWEGDALRSLYEQLKKL